MTLTPEDQALVNEALDAVISVATEARQADDLEAAKLALNRLWFTTHKAYETLRDAEDRTRRAALSTLEHAA